ncbi:phosphoglucosamine mutase [Natronomonas sp. CBA1123]|uniref:phosphoglucosamine mutase n=1 Tax=Natronomonas sp. CBA1123 TaxID=2668070 RepID=UPI0012EA63B2|nr:phosphoglucosamine mutase [Natronomonas sp. CBA1123]MUV85692.1 phosphoglucosamine mutase [Natronomonas sp. CBA1123]
MSFGRMGIRGVANRTVTAERVFELARAATAYWEADRVAIGRDTRTTGEMFDHVATAGAENVGATVDRLGVVPTPALQHYVETRSIPGLQITASHNPPDHNGVKLVGRDGSVLEPTAVEAVASLAEESVSAAAPESTGQSRTVESAADEYVESVVESVDRETIREAAPTVVVDPGNGAGALTSPALFRRLGCQVETLNAQPDGAFPGRDPEPVEDELTELLSFVASSDADLGIAHDGDADRVVFVDESGAFVDGNAAFAALAAAELDEGETVVTTCNASLRLRDVAEAAGGTVEYTPIGNTYVLSRTRELREAGVSVPIAGEGNGGIVYPAHRLGRDGGYVAARFLELLADRPASALLEPHRGYSFERENVPYDGESERAAIMERAEAWAASANGEETTLDGYRVDFEESWALVRPSGTEPYVRVYAEAKTPQEAAELANSVRRRVEE